MVGEKSIWKYREFKNRLPRTAAFLNEELLQQLLILLNKARVYSLLFPDSNNNPFEYADDLVKVRVAPSCDSPKIVCSHGFKVEVLDYKLSNDKRYFR